MDTSIKSIKLFSRPWNSITKIIWCNYIERLYASESPFSLPTTVSPKWQYCFFFLIYWNWFKSNRWVFIDVWDGGCSNPIEFHKFQLWMSRFTLIRGYGLDHIINKSVLKLQKNKNHSIILLLLINTYQRFRKNSLFSLFKIEFERQYKYLRVVTRINGCCLHE